MIMIPVDKMEVVFKTCCDILELDLSKRTKKVPYVRGRWIFFGVVRELGLNRTLDEIGGKINQDHATVIHGYKQFNSDILGSPLYCPLYLKCVDACKIAVEIGDINVLSGYNVAEIVNKEFHKHQKEVQELSKRLSRFTSDPLMRDIANMNDEQYKIFKERSKVMLKMIKSIRTYENTPKKEFNAA